MKIVNITYDSEYLHGTPQIMEVPDDYIRCSISGELRPKSEFCNDAGVQTRTNCVRTYFVPTARNAVQSVNTATLMAGPVFKKLQAQLVEEQALLANSQPIGDLIAALRKLQAQNPAARILMSQEGYYAEGRFADLYPEPQHYAKSQGVCFYSLGHSSQNY